MADGVVKRQRLPPLFSVSLGVHGAGVATLLVDPRSWQVVVAALAANHLGIVVAGLLPRCGWLGPNITRLPEAQARRDLVALTFDDGPDPEVTPAVLDLLERANARATFFCIGSRAEANASLVSSIRARGHGVENHTYTHPNSFALHGPGWMKEQILQGQRAIEDSGGGRPLFFRAPAGIRSPWLGAVVARAGLSLVSWSRRGYDTVTRSSGRVAHRLAKGLRAGDILLLHDGSSARDQDGRPVVLRALERTLESIDRQGLRSEALHRLF